jgi:hypothetical protein
MSKILTIAAALTISMPVAAAELVSSNRCADKACQSDFGRPMAYCEGSSTKTELGETVTFRDTFFAKFAPNGDGWIFDTRTNTEHTSLKLTRAEFDEKTGRLQFSYRTSSILGRCRRFTSQLIARRHVERTPYLGAAVVDVPGGYRWGEWERMPQILGGQ